MTTHTSPRSSGQGGRALAFVAGCVFLAGTVGILFEDVILHDAPLALKHGLTLAVLAGTIMAGHLANTALRDRSWLASGVFALVALAGTALVIYQSVGRQAADTIQTAAQIEADAQRRIEITAARKRSQDMLDSAQKTLADKCVKGSASRSTCNGFRSTVEVYTAAVAGHDAKLDKLGASRVASPEAEQFAEIVATVFDADKGKVKAAAILIMPFAMALFLEMGAIISFGYAFRHAPATISARVSGRDSAQASFPSQDDERLALFLEEDAPEPPKGGNGGPKPGKSLPSNVVRMPAHPVISAIQRNGGSVASNKDLAGLLGVSPGEACKSRQEVADQLVTERDGKCLRIALK